MPPVRYTVQVNKYSTLTYRKESPLLLLEITMRRCNSVKKKSQYRAIHFRVERLIRNYTLVLALAGHDRLPVVHGNIAGSHSHSLLITVLHQSASDCGESVMSTNPSESPF